MRILYIRRRPRNAEPLFIFKKYGNGNDICISIKKQFRVFLKYVFTFHERLAGDGHAHCFKGGLL